MATIKITRTKEFNNYLRDFQVFIDGQKVGTIANGETKEFEVSPGSHTINAKIEWCNSPEISFDTNETKSFMVGGFIHGNWLMPLGFLLILLHYVLQITVDFRYTFYILLPLFLYFAYFLTLGRQNYLTLKTADSQNQ
jgi:hypothetical protein